MINIVNDIKIVTKFIGVINFHNSHEDIVNHLARKIRFKNVT